MRFVYWSLSTFFFFAAAIIVVSWLKPGPTETQVMRWMQGMMSAMHSSLMGASMESSETFGFLMQSSAHFSILTLLLGICAGIPLRMWMKRD